MHSKKIHDNSHVSKSFPDSISSQQSVARQNGFDFKQINQLTIKIYSNLSQINVHYYLKLRIPIMHRHFFRIISQNHDYVKTFHNDLNSPFYFEICK